MAVQYRLRFASKRMTRMLATHHAPKGGITIAGKKFKGGEFVSEPHLAQATDEQRSKLEKRSEGLFDEPQEPAERPQPVPISDPRIAAALTRAEQHKDPYWNDTEAHAGHAQAFEALPVGTQVVSLDEDTLGKIGKIVKDERGRNRVQIDGATGFASNHVEPLDEKLSWRVPKQAQVQTEKPIKVPVNELIQKREDEFAAQPTARKIPGPLKRMPDGTMGNEFLIIHPDGTQTRGMGRNAADAIKRVQGSQEKIDGGKADNKPDTEFPAEALDKGAKVEMEHTNDPAQAKEIAKDHLTERGDYYDKLSEMEKSPEATKKAAEIKQPHEMTKAEHQAAIDAAPTNQFVTTHVEDWGTLRGQGKRSGGMVMGGMRDSSLQGKKTYVNAFGKLPEEERRDAHGLIEGLGQLAYAKARAHGFDHEHAMLIGYEADDPEYVSAHKRAIENAIEAGKHVPPEVLAEYPDLERAQKEIESKKEEETQPEQSVRPVAPPIATASKIDEPDPVTTSTTPEAKAAEPKPEDSPRSIAARVDKAMDHDYEFSRASAIGNFGEDLKGSARHKANAWKGLADAEKNGTAEQLVTRDNLLKAEPHNLMNTITPINALSALAAHLAINAFPASPFVSFNHEHYVRLHNSKYKDGGRDGSVMPNEPPKTEEEIRKQYFDAYQSVKAEAEKAAVEEIDPRQVAKRINSLAGNLIAKLRGEKGNDLVSRHVAPDSFNPVANALVDLYNRTKSYPKTNNVVGRLNDFAGRVKANYPGDPTAETLDKISNHVQDVIEGASFNQAFGTKAGAAKRFDPAEAYVAHAERKGGRVIDAATVEAAKKHMLENIGLRGVQWGNYVTDSERQHHLTKTAEAFADLADAIGVPDSAISLGGRLGLAIGARGRANARAHYEPITQIINLTRASGVGSLAHEWAHGLDHYLEGFANSESGANYSSHGRDDGGDIAQAMKAIRLAFHKSGFHDRLLVEIRKLIREGRLSKNADYWTSPHEMFARTFERHIQDKLHSLDRENTYLTGLRKTGHPLWPNKEEVAKIAPLMEALFDAIKTKHFKAATTLATAVQTKARIAYRLVFPHGR